MTHEEAVVRARAFMLQARSADLHDEDQFQGAVLSLSGLLWKAAADARPVPTPWELFHRLWTKAVGTQRYDKTEWTYLEAALLTAGLGPEKGPAKP